MKRAALFASKPEDKIQGAHLRGRAPGCRVSMALVPIAFGRGNKGLFFGRTVKVVALGLMLGVLAGGMMGVPVMAATSTDDRLDYLIDRVNEASYQNNHPEDRVLEVVAGAGALGIAYWGYNAGKKTRSGAARDFCNFSAIVFGVKGTLLMFGGAR